MTIDLNTLKTELLMDPANLGLSGKTDQEAADLLNAVPATNTDPLRRVIRASVPTWEIVGCFTRAEFNALSANDKSYIQGVLSCGSIDPANTNIVAAFGGMFGGASLTNLSNVRYQATSRAETLFGVKVQYYDVGQARNI